MLTENQIQQLKPLTRHKKFGNLLKAAIKGWKDTIPVENTFGLYIDKKDHIFKGKQTCLIAAALVNKKPKKRYVCGILYYEEIRKRFNLSNNDIYGLIHGFDNSEWDKSPGKYGYLFGKKVRKIVNPKHPYDL